MDSAHSGSLQSSSGGDEEYDSRAAGSIFMTGHPPQRQMPPPLFDPLSNYMQLHHNPNSLLFNQNISWPGTTSTRSDPNSSTSHNAMINHMPPFQPPSPAADGAENHHAFVAPVAQNQNQTAARNSKKRSRASRRAPTTVLTTDTTNFRAMVQEFTGIPAQPFNNSSFSRSRLDLFGTRSAVFEPPYLRRPFPQKVQSPPPFLVSSSLFDSITASSTADNGSLNLFNVQNPLVSSLLQSNQKFIFSNSSVMASRPHNHIPFEIPSNDTKTGPGLDEFGLSDVNHVSAALTGLPDLISSDQIAAQTDHNDTTNENSAESWRKNGLSRDEEDDYQARMKRINGGYSYSNAPPQFDGEKRAEKRSEGMVESWICSSE